MTEWLADPRCRAINRMTIRSRIRNGATFEEAICNPRRQRLNEAFGESKLLSEWAKDPRCRIAYPYLVHLVRQNGDLETILTEPHRTKEEQKVMLTAFGETKMASEWAKDPRCSVTLTAILDRLDRGKKPEEAISDPISYIVLQEAFGEYKTISDWARDPRCVVSRTCLARRVNRGERLEDALTFVGRMDRS